MNRTETAKLWTERLQRFEQAQTAVAQFCNAEGVSQPSFYYWKRKLRPPQDPKTSAVANFVPVSFHDTPDRPAPAADHVIATIELPGGIRIRVELPADSQPKPPRKSDRKFPDHLPRFERIVDLPEDRREGLKLISYDEVETLEWIRPELRVRVNKYAKYVPAHVNQ